MARILLIDDEANIRMMVRLALEHVGHKVDAAADGPEGLEKYADGAEYDLVLLDQRMPGMEGLEVLRVLKQRRPQARVIMITAFGTIDLAVEAMKSGATDFLRKPFTAETLRGAVKASLSDTSHTTGDGVATRPIKYGMTLLNGFHIAYYPGTGERSDMQTRYVFEVRSPDDETRPILVTLPDYMVELVRAQMDSEEFPGGQRFWEALCEEALANYLWQNATFPEENLIEVIDLTGHLKRWIESAMAANE
jgi:DNA-binding response OmpR family regulator